MKVFFVRHGKDDDRYRGGWSNFDLIPEGTEQAKRLAKHLRENNSDYNIKQIISSDILRAITTANIISDELKLPVKKEFKLREINNGDLAGMRNDTTLKQYPGLFFSSLKLDEAYPNGESPRGFYMRIKIWFEEFLIRYSNTNGNILVVTHAGVINIIYHLVRRIEWSNKGRSFKADNCSIHILNVDTMKFETENRKDYLTS